MPPIITKPSKFKSFEEMVDYAHAYVYSITRLRNQGGQTRPVPLGTAFLGGKNRMLTCAHCVNNLQQPNEPLAQHQDGDVYVLVNKDQRGNAQTSFITPNSGKDLFIYHNIDVAIFHLPDDFYQVKNKYIRNPKNHLIFDRELRLIGAEAGIIGYPMQQLTFTPAGDINYGSLIIRADKGVINTRYLNAGNSLMYEFTMSFNPGNSGGPIVNALDGKVIGIVHGFTSQAIRLNGGGIDWRTYSQAYAAENIKTLQSQHSLAFA